MMNVKPKQLAYLHTISRHCSCTQVCIRSAGRSRWIWYSIFPL